MTNICEKTKQFNESVKKWAKIIHDGHAIITSNGLINPEEKDINDDTLCFTAWGNPFNIARAAAEYRKMAR